MANTNKLISLANLTTYDERLKLYIDSAETLGIKTALYDSTNKQIKFYKKPEATLADTADFSVDIPANLDGSAVIATISEGIVTLKAGITETDGIVANADATQNPDITLAKVASTGAATDVSIADAGDYFTSTNVEGALQELADASAGGVDSKTVWLKSDETVTSGYLKTYGLYQGANSPDHPTAPATLIGKLDIPKDLVVTSGKVVSVEDGVDSDGETTSVADGTYLKLTIANQTEKVYINVVDLANTYTANNQTAEVTITIDNTNNITALVGEVAATKSIYTDAVPATYVQVTSSDSFDPSQTYYTKEGDVYTADPSVTAENFDVKVAVGLYVVDTPAVAKQTVKAKLDELDYVVATSAEISALFD